MAFKDKVQKKKREVTQKNRYAKYDSILQNYKQTLRKIASSTDSLISKNKTLQTKNDSLKKTIWHNDSIVNHLNRDSLFCFCSKSQSYLDKSNNPLKQTDWILYFDKNKGEMLKKYQLLKADPQYAICERIQKEKIELAKRRKEEAKRLASANQSIEDIKRDKAKAVFQSLSIQNLGIFNCDQISRLREPVINIFADYQDA